MPKTGGETFRDILEAMSDGHLQRDYGDRPLAPPSIRQRIRLATARPHLDPGTRVVHGHFIATKYWRRYPDARYMAWFREPVERLASHYHYWKRKPDHKNPTCQKLLSEDLSLEAFAALPEMRDVQARYALDLPEALAVGRETQPLTLAAGAATPFSFEVLPVALGNTEWTRLPMRTLGPLRLAWWSASLPVEEILRVVPDALSSHDRSTGLVRAGATAQRRQGSGQELHHLRQYRPGDPRHAIDWKATARTGRPHVRVFTEERDRPALLVRAQLERITDPIEDQQRVGVDKRRHHAIHIVVCMGGPQGGFVGVVVILIRTDESVEASVFRGIGVDMYPGLYFLYKLSEDT